jgi:hypothetical protein
MKSFQSFCVLYQKTADYWQSPAMNMIADILILSPVAGTSETHLTRLKPHTGKRRAGETNKTAKNKKSGTTPAQSTDLNWLGRLDSNQRPID